VAAELVANGWSQADAEEIAEEARRKTRRLRGVTIHADAARAYGAGDPTVARDATPFARPSMFGAVGGLCRAIARLWTTRNVGRRQ
jgi:hypothetical protein